MGNSIFFSIALLIIAKGSMPAQVLPIDSLQIDKICVENRMREKITKNIVCHQFLEKRNSDKKSSVFTQLENTFFLDTNQYLVFSFKKINSLHFKNYILIEFRNSVAEMIVERPNKKSGGLPILNSGDKDLRLAAKGIIAYKGEKEGWLFVSGLMFLDDFKSEFFKNCFTNDAKVLYTQLKYYNYDPYDIRIVNNYIYFKSRVNLTGNEFNYRYILKSSKKNVIEGALEVVN